MSSLIRRFTSSPILSIGDFEYLPFSSEYTEPSLQIQALSFRKLTPLVSHLGISEESFKELCLNMLDNYKGRELSLVCIHKPSSEVCGSFICNQLHSTFPYQYSNRINLDFARLFTLLDILSAEFFLDIAGTDTQILHLGNLSVHPKWSGKNIGYNLLLATIEVAKKNGLNCLYAELISPITQHLCLEKMNFVSANSMNFEDFEYLGKKIFTGLEGKCVISYKMLE